MSTYIQNLPASMRDCVRKCLEKGVKTFHEFDGWRYGIICELKQRGCNEEAIKKIMKEWVEKYPQKFTYKKFNQSVGKFVDWIFKKGAKVGCKYFKEKNYCSLPCEFEERMRNEANAELSQEVICSKDEIRRFLAQQAQCKHPDQCAAIYKAIDRKRVKEGFTRDKTVYIGLREIKEAAWEEGFTLANSMEVSRLVNELQDSELLEIAVKGQRGEFKSKANGYKLFTPDEVLKNSLNNLNDETVNS